MAMRAVMLVGAMSIALGPIPPRATAQVPDRAPLAVARVLAARYPEAPIMSYIPGLAWAGSYRLAELTGEARWMERPRAEMRPFLTGERPAIAERYALTSLAGHLAFADAAVTDRSESAGDLAILAADFILPESPDEVVRFATGWTDDMFMATSVWARVAANTGDERYASAVGRLLTEYADRLQRADGLFIHSATGAYAWGRGNGFAALGLTEALTLLPNSWADRPRVLEAYRRLMSALLPHQTDDGSWRQVIDQPTAYQELSVTALALTAMARGVRLGWLDAETYRPVIDRAWGAVLTRLNEDGTLRDVCTSTGAQATLEYYMTRPVVNGADDRGGAIVLLAAVEMETLRRSGSVSR